MKKYILFLVLGIGILTAPWYAAAAGATIEGFRARIERMPFRSTHLRIELAKGQAAMQTVTSDRGTAVNALTVDITNTTRSDITVRETRLIGYYDRDGMGSYTPGSNDYDNVAALVAGVRLFNKMTGAVIAGPSSDNLGTTGVVTMNDAWTIRAGETLTVAIAAYLRGNPVENDGEFFAFDVDMLSDGSGRALIPHNAQPNGGNRPRKVVRVVNPVLPTPTSMPSPSITVISPNGGEVFFQGSAFEYKWISSGVGDTVKITTCMTPQSYERTTKGESRCSLSHSEPNTGSYKNTFGEAASPGEYMIKIEDAKNPSVYDEGDAPFSIMPLRLAVDIRVNGSDTPEPIAFTTPFVVSWKAPRNMHCYTYGMFVPTWDDQSINWANMDNNGPLPPTGSIKLAATLLLNEDTPTYHPALMLGMECVGKRNKIFKDEIIVPVLFTNG